MSKVLSSVTSKMLSKKSEKAEVKNRTKQITKQLKEQNMKVKRHADRVSKAEKLKSNVMDCLDTTGRTVGDGYEI